MASDSGVHLPSLFQPCPTSIPVIDPKLKQFGRLWIDMNRVEHTKAVERWISEDPRQSSLCLLYSKGECNAGDKCNQLHVDRSYTFAVRERLAPIQVSNCCFGHGDIASIREDFQDLLQRHPVEFVTDGCTNTICVPAPYLAVTTFWDQYLHDRKLVPGPIRISPGRVCRLHQRDACKFGTDCNNLHVCREFWASVPALNQTFTHALQRRASEPTPAVGQWPSPQFHSKDDCGALQGLSPSKADNVVVGSGRLSTSPPKQEGTLHTLQELFPPRRGSFSSALPACVPIQEPSSPITVKVVSPKKEEMARSRKMNPPPLQMEAIHHEEPMSPFCLFHNLSGSFQIPSPDQSPNAYPYYSGQSLRPSYQAVPQSLRSPPIAPARNAQQVSPLKPISPRFAPEAMPNTLQPDALASNVADSAWSSPTTPLRYEPEQTPFISYQRSPQIQHSPQCKPMPTILHLPRQPLSTEKYLKFLMYTKAEKTSRSSSTADAILDACKAGIFAGEPNVLDQQAMLEKLPSCLLEALDYDIDNCN